MTPSDPLTASVRLAERPLAPVTEKPAVDPPTEVVPSNPEDLARAMADVLRREARAAGVDLNGGGG